MKLYLLQATAKGHKQLGYDCAHGFVVRAKGPKSARKLISLAAINHTGEGPGDEGAEFWLDAKLSSCTELKSEGEEEIILSDFYAA